MLLFPSANDFLKGFNQSEDRMYQNMARALSATSGALKMRDALHQQDSKEVFNEAFSHYRQNHPDMSTGNILRNIQQTTTNPLINQHAGNLYEYDYQTEFPRSFAQAQMGNTWALNRQLLDQGMHTQIGKHGNLSLRGQHGAYAKTLNPFDPAYSLGALSGGVFGQTNMTAGLTYGLNQGNYLAQQKRMMRMQQLAPRPTPLGLLQGMRY